METNKKQITKVLLDPRVQESVNLARICVWIKRDEYKDQGFYFDYLNEVIEDLDKVLFLIAQLNLEEEARKAAEEAARLAAEEAKKAEEEAKKAAEQDKIYVKEMKYAEQEKVLKIIKDNINVPYLIQQARNRGQIEITNTEFNLLKEYLK